MAYGLLQRNFALKLSSPSREFGRFSGSWNCTSLEVSSYPITTERWPYVFPVLSDVLFQPNDNGPYFRNRSGICSAVHALLVGNATRTKCSLAISFGYSSFDMGECLRLIGSYFSGNPRRGPASK